MKLLRKRHKLQKSEDYFTHYGFRINNFADLANQIVWIILANGEDKLIEHHLTYLLYTAHEESIRQFKKRERNGK